MPIFNEQKNCVEPPQEHGHPTIVTHDYSKLCVPDTALQLLSTKVSSSMCGDNRELVKAVGMVQEYLFFLPLVAHG